jgi:hypothetical protein
MRYGIEYKTDEEFLTFKKAHKYPQTFSYRNEMRNVLNLLRKKYHVSIILLHDDSVAAWESQAIAEMTPELCAAENYGGYEEYERLKAHGYFEQVR